MKKLYFWFVSVLLNSYVFAQSGFIKSYELNKMSALKQTSDGGYAATGIYGYATPESWDVYFIKFDEDINIEWQMKYGSLHGNESGQNFIQLDHGGYMITGYRMTVDFEQYRFHILKIDSEGNLDWIKYYNYFYGDLGSIVETDDGGAIISNFVYTDIGSVIMKIDSLGNVEWSKSVVPFVSNIIKMTDGNYVLSCGDGFIVKIDIDGNVLWSRHHDMFDFMSDLVSLNDNEFAGIGTNYYEDEPILTKFNDEGYSTWSNRYIFHPDLEVVNMDDIENTLNNEFYISGYKISSSVRMPILMKTDSSGQALWAKLPNDINGEALKYGLSSTTDGGSMMLVDAYNGGHSAYTIKFDDEGNAGCESDFLPVHTIPETLNVIDSSVTVSDYSIVGLPVEFDSEIPALPGNTLICGSIETPPCSEAPSGLFATNLTTNKAKLNWSADAGALKYKVQYRASTSPVWINASSTINSKKLSGLTAGTAYKYRVRSQCSPTLMSSWSAVSEFTTLPLKQNVNGEWSMVNIYPNPSDGHFTIQLPTSNNEEHILISIKNMLGEEIYIENIHAQELNYEINLDKNISSGIYFVEIKTTDKIYSQQIMISK